MKTKEANRQSFKQTIIIVGIIIAGFAFLANIILACVFPNCATNIFTAISGWVSGIATVILGIVAIVQNRKYKEENDDNIQKQYNFEIFKLIITQREQYVSRIKKVLEDFMFEYDYKNTIPIIEEIGRLYHPLIKNSRTDELRGKIDTFYKELESKVKLITQLLEKDNIKSDEQKELLNVISQYKKTALSNKDFPDYTNQSTILVLYQTVGKVYQTLQIAVTRYIDKIEDDLRYTITEKSTDLEYIKQRYTQRKEQNNG